MANHVRLLEPHWASHLLTVCYSNSFFTPQRLQTNPKTRTLSPALPCQPNDLIQADEFPTVSPGLPSVHLKHVILSQPHPHLCCWFVRSSSPLFQIHVRLLSRARYLRFERWIYLHKCPLSPHVSNIRMIMRTRKWERLAFCPSLNYKMAIVSLGDVIVKLVWRPETITDGITLELPEMQQVQPFQQQWASLTLHPRKDRDQWDRQGSLLLSDEGDSWQERVPVGFTSQTNKRDFFFFCLLHLSRFSPSSFFFFQRKGIGPL